MSDKSTGEPAPPFFIPRPPRTSCSQWSATRLSSSCRHLVGGLIVFLLLTSTAAAQSSVLPVPAPSAVGPEENPPPIEIPAPPPATLGQLVRMVVIATLAEDRVDERHWNKQAERWDGFHVRGLKVSKRTKLVNHGFWRKYSFRLIEPEETLSIDIQQRPVSADERIPFEISADVQARVDATFAAWTWGVKGVNGKAVCDVRLGVNIELLTSPRVRLTADSLLPQFRLETQVGKVVLQFKEMKVHEIGILKGPLADELGGGAKELVQEIVERQAGKVREALQKELGPG